MEYYLSIKISELLSYIKSRRKFRCNCQVRQAGLKRLRRVWGTIWHSRRCKTVKWKDQQLAVGHKVFWGQQNYSVCYHDNGYVVPICQNLWNCTTQRVNSNLNYGLWLIRYQIWFINCNKCTTLRQDTNCRWNQVWRWDEYVKCVFGISLYFVCIFFNNPKPL